MNAWSELHSFLHNLQCYLSRWPCSSLKCWQYSHQELNPIPCNLHIGLHFNFQGKLYTLIFNTDACFLGISLSGLDFLPFLPFAFISFMGCFHFKGNCGGEFGASTSIFMLGIFFLSTGVEGGFLLEPLPFPYIEDEILHRYSVCACFTSAGVRVYVVCIPPFDVKYINNLVIKIIKSMVNKTTHVIASYNS